MRTHIPGSSELLQASRGNASTATLRKSVRPAAALWKLSGASAPPLMRGGIVAHLVSALHRASQAIASIASSRGAMLITVSHPHRTPAVPTAVYGRTSPSALPVSRCC